MEAEIYHITAIIIFYIYVPVKIDFITHILTSYKNNYSGKLCSTWGEEFFPTK